MKLKYIVPDMAQTFGNLEFAGENDVEQQRVNGRFVPVTRSYNLYSDIQRADDIIVVLQRILFDAIICRIRKIKTSHF